MKSSLFASLLVLCVTANAVIENPDGSFTFSRGDSVLVLDNFRNMQVKLKEYEQKMRQANITFYRMQQKIEELSKRECI